MCKDYFRDFPGMAFRELTVSARVMMQEGREEQLQMLQAMAERRHMPADWAEQRLPFEKGVELRHHHHVLSGDHLNKAQDGTSTRKGG